ncbi:hypothetical protein GFB49_17420 [Epibacterium sp. SM1979]|uniref:Uncharacterized protein n=1 Tax=Tritonibacter litoralis TaxID=2662264 RepID=A0A843YHB9_9RHOB|nr:hypothetical protein [Tritonibacter litoralis]MQQ10251.1 hypothetical protein [Tritonibacter litoralis]
MHIRWGMQEHLDGFFSLSYRSFMADPKTPKKQGSDANREDRLKAALKANMARRKAQAKARSTKPVDAAGKTEG